jgi:hypothetical protein
MPAAQASGMAGSRCSREELDAAAGASTKGLVDRVLHHHAAERHRARGDPLGERDQVGLDAEVLRGERLAEASPPGDHLVHDQQDAVARADLAQAARGSPLGGMSTPPDAETGSTITGGDVRRVVQRDQALFELVGELHRLSGAVRGKKSSRRNRGYGADSPTFGSKGAAIRLAVGRHAADRNARRC